MQSKTSFFNKALYKKNISRTWIPGLLYFVLLLICQPISFIISTANIEDDWYSQLGYTMEMRLFEHMSSQPSATFSIVISIVVTAITFWYLFNRRDSYMMHAFPVSRRSLYFTGLASSFTVSIVPVILTAAIMSVAALASGAGNISCVWYWALITAFTTVLFTSIAMFSLMITGQLVTGIVFYCIFNFLYLLMEIAFRLTARILVYGMDAAMNGIQYNCFTPYLFILDKIKIISNVVTDDDYTKVIDFTYEYTGGKYMIGYTVFAILLIIFTYQLYRFKKLETVLDFISVPFMKPVFSVGMSFFISMVAGAFVAGMIEAIRVLSYDGRYAIAIVSTLIIGAIIYFATQMMIEKTLRVFCLKKTIHCVIYSVAALAVMLCMRFDVVGVENRVPKLEDIAWAGIQNDYTMVFTDEMEIEAFRQLHQNFLEDKKELRDINYNYRDVDGKRIEIRYKLKNGRIIIRSYPVINTEASVVSPEYLAATQPIIDFLNNPGRIKQHIIGNIWDDCEVRGMELSTIIDIENGKDYNFVYSNFDELSTTEKYAKFQRVYDAILKDIDAGKLFQQNFAGYEYNYKQNQKRMLYNDFNFTIYNKDKVYFSDENTFQDYVDTYSANNPSWHEQNIYVNLNLDCTNTLKALKDEGFYTSDEDLMTNYTFDKKYEN